MSKAHSEPSQRQWRFCENSERLKAVDYFCKQLYLRRFNDFSMPLSMCSSPRLFFSRLNIKKWFKPQKYQIFLLCFKNTLDTSNRSLHKIYQNMGCLLPVFSRMRTESTILSLYVKMWVRKNPYFGIFYLVGPHNI